MNYTWSIVRTCNTLQWRQNERDGVSNLRSHDCLPKRLFRCRSKKTSKLRVTGLCVGNSPVTGELSAQMASDSDYMFPGRTHFAIDFVRLFPIRDATRRISLANMVKWQFSGWPPKKSKHLVVTKTGENPKSGISKTQFLIVIDFEYIHLDICLEGQKS